MFDDQPETERPHLSLLGVPITILPWHFILLAVFFYQEILKSPLLGVAMVMLGMFSLNPVGIMGSIVQQLNHGISTGAL